MINATQLRAGMIIIHEGDLFRVTAVKHLTPGKGHGFMQTKLKNLKSGTGTEHKFRSEERVDRATLDTREMQYLYGEGDIHTFMDTETYEQTELPAEEVGDILPYMLPNHVVSIQFFDGSPVGVELASPVELEVVETEPALKGATASASYKPANRSFRPGSPLHSSGRSDSCGSRRGKIYRAGEIDTTRAHVFSTSFWSVSRLLLFSMTKSASARFWAMDI
jgi:elongation factor P